MGTRQRAGLTALAAAAAVFSLSAPASAAPLSVATTSYVYALITITLAVIVFVWAFIVVRKLSRDKLKAQERISLLEARLNETEAALAAEPNVLFIWRGRDNAPDSVFNNIRGQADIPESAAALAAFHDWLDKESVKSLQGALEVMRQSGSPFNIGIETKKSELLEADGRTAGGLATLRLRPLSGERLNVKELAHDVRKLSRQVERLSAILDLAPLSIWLRDSDGALTWVNQAYVAAVDNSDVNDVVSRGIELAGMAKLRNGGDDDEKSVSMRKLQTREVIDGANRTLDLYEVRLDDGTAGFAIDATAADEAKKELKRHMRAQTGMLDKLTTAIAIFGPDKRLRFNNAAYSDLWSLEQTWLDSGPLDGEILDKLRETRRLPEQANYRDWKEQQLEVYTKVEPTESWWHLPDGQTVRVLAEQHPFGGVSYFYENVTEKLMLESRFNELNRTQRETLDNLHEAVALFGTNGCVELYNPSFVGFWALDVAFLDDLPHVDQVIERFSRLYDDTEVWQELKFAVTELSDKRTSIQHRLNRPDGKILEMATVPLPDGNTLLTFVDVTSIARMELALRERNDALEAADRLKTNFLSNVSYELRTPLNSIIGFAEYLSLGMAGELQPKQSEYVSDIQASSSDLLSIIDAILDLTTIDAGAMELSLEAIDIAELMQGAGEAMSEQIGKRNQTLKIEIAEDAAEIVGDKRRLHQVLVHLLSNAIGFSENGSSVRMGANRDSNDLLLWVADTGRGMEPEFQKQVFDRFQSRPAAKGHRGAGLGLSLVKSFVELHDGQVMLKSQPNKGTTVICRLPVDGPQIAGNPGAAAATGLDRQAISA